MPRQNASRSLSITSQENYGAVIIADLVADVETDGDGQATDHHSHADVEKNHSSIQEKVNLAYDDKTDTSPAAVVNVDSVEIVNLGMAKTNGGSNLSRGVILNAEFGLPDPKLNGKDKSMELNKKQSVSAEGDPKKKSKGFVAELKEMTILRKIAFGFSFLPSIMFVLCFSVILPCEVKMPCVQDLWSVTLDNTKVTSDLKLVGDLIFTFSKGSGDGLESLDARTGNVRWTDALESDARSMDCGKLAEGNGQSCFVIDTEGKYHLYNASTGAHIQHLKNLTSSEFSSAVVLPDCDGDGLDEVAFADSRNSVKVLFASHRTLRVDIAACDSVPSRLTSWTKENGTDLVLVCQNGENDHLIRISQDEWCGAKKKSSKQEGIQVLDTRSTHDLKRSVILATQDILAVWTENEVTLFNSSGTKDWTISTESHSGKRFMLYGNFNGTDKQVVLFSSDINRKLQVTMLEAESGHLTWNKTLANAELSDVQLIHGGTKDFALVHIRKVQRDLKSEAVTHINGISSTLMSLLSQESTSDYNGTDATVTEEISFMEMGGSFLHPIEERKVRPQEGEYSTSLTAFLTDVTGGKDLSVVVLKRAEPPSTLSSLLRSIQVANWDISQTQGKECLLK